MKMRIKSGFIWMLCSLMLLALSGCYTTNKEDSPKAQGQVGNADIYGENVNKWNCAWYVYWNTEVSEELSTLKDDVASICMFSCFFDDNAQIYKPKGFSELQELVEVLEFPMIYLSFTNDVQHADGSSTQKDAELLKRLWADESRMEKTADDILAAARSIGVHGIEIDFENITESELWADYIQFLNVLWDKVKAENLSLRVVLSVNAPIEDVQFPAGPAYTVMCYNLYGTHSGPGPKADAAFLKKTAEKFSRLPNVSYALATGGFEWDEKDKVTRSLTQEMAEELLHEYERLPERDEASQDLYYDYQKDNEGFTVWYADKQTLAAWRKVIQDIDPDAGFDLWRVGGNRWE